MLADAAKLFQVRCASARREWRPEASEGVSLPWTAKADPALILPLLQSLGLPEEVLEAVRARIEKLPRRFLKKKTALVASSQD